MLWPASFIHRAPGGTPTERIQDSFLDVASELWVVGSIKCYAMLYDHKAFANSNALCVPNANKLHFISG